MNKVLGVMIVLALMVTGPAFSQEYIKIGYVDMKKAMNDCKAGKAALVKLEKTANEKQAAIDKEKKKLESLQADLDKKAVGLSDKDREDKQIEFQKKVQVFQKMVGQNQQEFNEMQAESTKKIFNDMKKAIADVAKADNFTIIIEKTSTSILYSKDGLDLTEKVREKMDSQ